MVNQRGQAFSVFELMIAAIVAIAILFVLLPIISGITTPTGDARQTIGNALSANSYGVSETGAFQIEDGDTIRASQLSSKADECSFYFEASLFPDSQIVHNEDADSEICDSYIKNLSSSPVNARASVICESTIEELDDSLETAGFEDLELVPSDFFIEDNGLFDKMCVVVLKRASGN